MRIVTRYLLAEFLKILILFTISFISLFLVIDFFERIDDFIDSQVEFFKTALYFLFKVPFVMVHMVPVAVLLGIIFSLGLLSRHNEITALRTNGISPYRIFFPFLLASILVVSVSFIINEKIMPSCNSRASRIWNVEVKKKPMGVLKHEKIWYRGYHSIYNVQVLNPKKKALQGVTIHKFDEDFNLIQRIDARYANWIDESWHFYDGIIKTIEPDGSISMEAFKEKIIYLPEKMDDFCYVEKTVEEMSYSELKGYVKRIKMEGYDATSYLPDMYAKISFPCVNIIMAIFGFAIMWRIGKHGGIAMGVIIGIGIGFIYWIIHATSISLGHAGILPPILSAWLANLIFSLLALSIIPHIRFRGFR